MLFRSGDDLVQNPKTSSVMITGNRVDATSLCFGKPGAWLCFVCVAAISSVTRCVLSSNMILNDAMIEGGPESGLRRFCFLLDDGEGAPLAETVPPPEIMVSGNVFQGRLAILPARYPSNTRVPAPMNSWDFLNTVIP